MKAFFTGTFLFTLLLSSTGGRLFAQDTTNVIGNVTIASPTAAGLAKYADLPVGYNTGITSTGVPIYTVESGTLKLPVGLSYHASGIRVEEMAGWVRRELRKDKIFVLGHSWGSFLGLQLATRHPEWLHAYIGVGQVIDGPESERRGWRFHADELGQLQPYCGICSIELR